MILTALLVNYNPDQVPVMPFYFSPAQELSLRSGRVMDCHATTQSYIPGGNGVKTELHVLHKGQVDGGAVSK